MAPNEIVVFLAERRKTMKASAVFCLEIISLAFVNIRSPTELARLPVAIHWDDRRSLTS